MMDISEWNGDFFYRWGRMIASLHMLSEYRVNRPIWLNNDHFASSEEWLKDRIESLYDEIEFVQKNSRKFRTHS